MRIGKYYLSLRRLWTATCAIAAYLAGSALVPERYKLAVQLIGAVILAFNVSPQEKFTPQLFESDAFKAVTAVEPLVPTSLASDLKEVVSLLKVAQAGYAAGAPAAVPVTSGSDIPPTVPSIQVSSAPPDYSPTNPNGSPDPIPSFVSGIPVVTLGDLAAAANASGATIVAPPVPTVVNAAPVPPVVTVAPSPTA